MLKKIAEVLNKKTASKFVGIFFLMLGSAALDLFSISIILPVVSIISSGNAAIGSSKILSVLSKILNTSDTNVLFVGSLILIVILFLIKSLYSFLYQYVMSKFSFTESRRLTNRLMNTYLGMPYEYHLENDSSTLIRKSIYDVEYFVITITDILDLGVKLLTFIAVFVYLMFISYRVTLILTALLVCFAILIIFVLKPRVKRISKEVQSLNNNNYKYLSQAFGGIKESKIYGTEFAFSKIYDDNRKNINELGIKRRIISSIPGNTIEFVGILGICLSLYLIRTFGGLTDTRIIEIFTVFAYGAVKLLPMVISTTGIFNSFAFYKTSVDTIYEDIKMAEKESEVDVESTSTDVLKFENKISIKNVSFAYKSVPNTLVLKDVDLEIKKNSSIIISGVSGSGKTTLIDVILGLLSPKKGVVEVDDKDISKNVSGWRKNISYIPQNIFLSDDSIRNNVAFGIEKNLIDDKRVWEALEKAQLKDFVESLPDGLDTVVGERGIRISGGQRQRIGIARAFYRDTNIVVFDEATSALDIETEKEIFDNVIKLAKNHTVIIVTHRENNAKLCEHHYKVVDNKVVKVK